MTLIVGNVMDVGLRGLDGALRVWAWFRPEEVGLIAPYRREWEIRQGEIAPGVDVIPGPAVVEVDCGVDAYTTVEVVVPDQESVALKDLFEQVYEWTPHVLSETMRERILAETAAGQAESAAAAAESSRGGALSAQQAAALSAATLAARVSQGDPPVLFTSDGYPYFADPTTITNTPLTVDAKAGLRISLGANVLHYDSGRRRLTAADVINGWTFGPVDHFRIRRIGDMVVLTIAALGLDGSNATSNVFYDPPAGFRPSTGGNCGTLGHVTASLGGGLSEQVPITKQLAGIASNRRSPISGVITYETKDAIPTTLPGTPD